MEAIALMIPDLPSADAILPFLRRIDAKRWYTNFGPLVREFEHALAEEVGSPGSPVGVVTTANATLALELALTALPLRPGARVLVPALTFVATATAILRAGFEPVIADIDPDSWLLTPAIATRALAEAAFDAVLPVATFGAAQNIGAWHAWSAACGKPVLIDAAAAFGNQSAGAVPTVFSLHATKSLGIGEGGFVASTDVAYLERIRRLSNFGFGPDHGDVVEAGTNAKMSEYHAAVGLAALPRWRVRREMRRFLQAAYRDALARTCPAVRLQRKAEGVPAIQVVALPEGADAGIVSAQLATGGIETRRWYCPPLHEHPAFSHCATAGALPVSCRLATRLLGLPFHLQLRPQDVERVCAELASHLHPIARAVARPRARHDPVARHV